MDDLKQLTPMMRQYMDIKKEHQDKVLFFRLGDFYEMFDKDAEEISHLLNLTLTHRGRTPMCGIPYHAMKNYLKRLLDAGKKVAICEQFLTGNPRELAERKVTQIYTPGTVIEDEYLDSFSSSFILAVSKDRKGIYTSWCDISTGEFYIRNLRLDKGYSELENLLESVKPKELLVPDDLYFSDIAFRETCDRSSSIITKLPIWYFSKKTGKEELEKHFSPNALRLYAIDPKDGILSVIGALLEYVEENAKSELPQLRTIERIEDESYIALNAAAVRNLELISSMTGSREGSLIDTIDRTLTSSGLRLLKFTLLHPLRKKEDIERRQRWVKRLMEDRAERERIRNSLQSSSDLERLSSKASMKRLTPRDFIAIADTIVAFFAMIQQRSEYMEFLDDELTGSFSDLISLSQDIVMGISRECTNISNEGTIILPGFDERLDELNTYVRNGSSILQEYLDKVTRETGISNIKTGENRIIGSYIEVSKGQLDKVPDYFIRRQTLVGGERFTTAELEEIKYRLSTAESESAQREKEVYNAFLERAYRLYVPISGMGKVISKLDVLSSLAEYAESANCVCPEILEEGDIVIEEGRHPVVEAYCKDGGFVSNSFSSSKARFALITGPNMAGKSTYLRQIALIVLLAHIGAMVPARKATIPLADRIFCRVGASDNLSRGESTFLVEMSETAAILRSATRRSLVIMDEVGRGTSTQDGMSLAYAVMKYLAELGSITLFATHYHELTMLDTYGMQLLHMAVSEEKDSIVFLRKAVEGAARSSYGIHVAKLAGLPYQVIREASAFQKRYFEDYSSFDDTQGNLFTSAAQDTGNGDRIISMIEDFDTDRSSPMDALVFISKLKEML